MSKNRHRNVDFKIDDRGSGPPHQLPSWQKVLNALLVFIIIGNFVIIFIYNKKTGDLNRQIGELNNQNQSMQETVNQLENQNARLEENLDQFFENHTIIKKTGRFEYESIRGTKKAKDGTTILGLEIDILSEIYRWECGNYEKIVRGDKEYEPADIISDYRRNENLIDSKGLICVGMASQEGTRGNEEQRAENRMETLLDGARKARVYDICPIYGLNLGQFVGKLEERQYLCTDSTLWQRRVVLLKIIKKRPNLPDKELKDCIISILVDKAKNKHIVFPIDIRDYSKYRNNGLTLREGSIR